MNTLVKIQKWAEVREEVTKINPLLGKFIDEASPKQSDDFVRITYTYGQLIVHNGELQIPLAEHLLVPISDPQVSPIIKNRLDYSCAPIGLVLNKTSEVFYESPDRIMPTKIFNKGALFGLWEIFDPPPSHFIKSIWSIAAGARTLFMLPKISDHNSHRHLKKEYKIKNYQPSSPLQHNKIFMEIANSPAIKKNKWTCDILFFTKAWHPNKDQKNKKNLYHFWLQEAWRQSFNCRNNMSFDMAWELFSYAVTKRNMKPKPIIINTLKHLLAIHDGIYPGYAPSINNDCGPIEELKEAYTEIYKIKTHPTLMEPTHLTKANRPVYYSLQLPSLIEYGPGSHGKNIITDLRELKYLSDMLEDSLDYNKRFMFFHTEEDTSLKINSTMMIPELDKNFLGCPSQQHLEFAYNSPFLKGCIQISLLKNRTTLLATEVMPAKKKNQETN